MKMILALVFFFCIIFGFVYLTPDTPKNAPASIDNAGAWMRVVVDEGTGLEYLTAGGDRGLCQRMGADGKQMRR